MNPLLERLRTMPMQVLVSEMTAGLLMGLVLTTDAIAVGLILMAGLPSGAQSVGILMALLSTAVTGVVVTLGSRLPIAVVGPSVEAAAILSVAAGAIHRELSQSGASGSSLPTVWALVGLSSVLTGLALWSIGRFRWSRFLQFVPYPVLGGFLAGIGWLVVQVGFSLVANGAEGMDLVHQVLQSETLLKLLPGLGLMAVLMALERWFDHFLVLPLCLLGAIALSHGVRLGLGVPLEAAIADGWFLSPLRDSFVIQNAEGNFLSQIHLPTLMQHSGALVGIVLLVPLVLMFEAVGIELALKQETNIDQTLKVNGIANMLIGLGGGSLSHLDLANTLIHQKAGATLRLAGLVAAGCILLALLSRNLLAYLPTFVVFSLTVLAGLDLLVEWLYQSWFRLSRMEYGLVFGIFLVISAVDFLPGIGLGILAACVVFVVNYSRVQAERYRLSGADHPSSVQRSPVLQQILQAEGKQIEILRLQGYLFFGTTTQLLSQVRQRADDPDLMPLRFLVLDFRRVSGMDSSAVLSFVKLRQLAVQHSFQLVFSEVRSPLERQLRQGGCLEEEDLVCHLFAELDRGVEWCENQILLTIPLRRQRSLPLALQLQNWFPHLDDASALMDYLEEISGEVGYLLFRHGDAPDGLFFIESGQISIILELADGTTQRLQTVGAGNIVGERSLYARIPHTSSAVAEKPCTLYWLSAQALGRMENEAPTLAAAFHRFVLHRLTEQLIHREQTLKRLLEDA
ncbi:cyclic nucleotide-binding domain-containing protein [Thermoleptolyngbya sichuanensis A183]|uniref:Cyclic nucleotide-binding domain-containing protein n=1 Tax=Thermoleptolyngbya sichuanensis A183 TaxID=2737172 RepID=A0A6M8BAW9_9CYAN|nr:MULTISPECIES: SulP family inorganic anion transporter [Thermoleptolyngbya]QKD81216.1 cyclic nucleotide-binding domain-containing protein [Thermoleptolyngbya sichuanensis A183]